MAQLGPAVATADQANAPNSSAGIARTRRQSRRLRSRCFINPLRFFVSLSSARRLGGSSRRRVDLDPRSPLGPRARRSARPLRILLAPIPLQARPLRRGLNIAEPVVPCESVPPHPRRVLPGRDPSRGRLKKTLRSCEKLGKEGFGVSKEAGDRPAAAPQPAPTRRRPGSAAAK
jgi:hypothetical protein